MRRSGAKMSGWPNTCAGRVVAGLAALLALVPGSGAAQCLTVANLERGIVVSQQRIGATVVTRAGGGLQYSFSYRAPLDGGVGANIPVVTDRTIRRDGPFPVSETGSLTAVPDDPAMMPLDFNSRWETTWRLQGRKPTLTPNTRARAVLIETGSNSNGLTTDRYTNRFDVTYLFETPKVRSLSGCDYEMMGITATFAGDTISFEQRFIYFPALGMAIQTVNHVSGQPAFVTGITGMRGR